MRYILYSIFILLLCGCKEKELTPVGQEYLLVNSEIPMQISLGFNPDGRFYGKAVNEFWGQYHIHHNVISFSNITNTMKSDTIPKMRAERIFLNSLVNGHTFEIKKGSLKIFFDEKGVLEFKN